MLRADEFHLASRQLLLGLSVLCESPLISAGLYALAHRTAANAGGGLGVLECRLFDETEHRRRIEARKALLRPDGRLTNWAQLLEYRGRHSATAAYPIGAAHLVVDSSRPVPLQVADTLAWLRVSSA